MENLSVYCLKYGEGWLPESMIFPLGSAEKSTPISFAIYLIKTKSRNILVDAGCDHMPEFPTKEFTSPSTVLKEVGLAPSDITDVIITHSHSDHIEAIKYFKRAILYITKPELERGKEYIPPEMTVCTFEKAFALDEKIVIREIGGHSTGSAVVEVIADDGIHVFCGDECYTEENIKKGIPTGTSENEEKSRSFIEKYSDGRYIVHTCHDISIKTQKII